jgi:hypothetical protein
MGLLSQGYALGWYVTPLRGCKNNRDKLGERLKLQIEASHSILSVFIRVPLWLKMLSNLLSST